MENWNDFEKKDYNEYVDNSEPPRASAYNKPKKEPRYVTTKSFVIVLILAIIVSASLGAGGYAFECFRGFGCDQEH